MDGKDDTISPSLMCRMLYPFWMLRSVVVIRFIKKDICVKGIKLPPKQVLMFIKLCSVGKIILVYLGDLKFQGIHWMSKMKL